MLCLNLGWGGGEGDVIFNIPERGLELIFLVLEGGEGTV